MKKRRKTERTVLILLIVTIFTGAAIFFVVTRIEEEGPTLAEQVAELAKEHGTKTVTQIAPGGASMTIHTWSTDDAKYFIQYKTGHMPRGSLEITTTKINVRDDMLDDNPELYDDIDGHLKKVPMDYLKSQQQRDNYQRLLKDILKRYKNENETENP